MNKITFVFPSVLGSISPKLIIYSSYTAFTQALTVIWFRGRIRGSHYAKEICKRTFFLYSLVLPSTLIRSDWKQSYRKHSWNRRNLWTPALCFSAEGNNLKRNMLETIMRFLCAWFPRTQLQNALWLQCFQIAPESCARGSGGTAGESLS